MNTVMKNDKCGIGYKSTQVKKVKAKAKAQSQYQAKYNYQAKPKPKTRRCFECGREGHFAHDCVTPPPQSLPKHTRPFTYNAHYLIKKDAKGKPLVVFLGPPSKNRPRNIWVAKSLVEKVIGPVNNGCLNNKLDLLCV